MMIDMKEGQLAILLPNHDKHSVHQLDGFAEHMQPHVVDDLQKFRAAVRENNWLTQ